MLKSYFTTAWRNLLKNKGYSAINIIGLATGLTVALLILTVSYQSIKAALMNPTRSLKAD